MGGLGTNHDELILKKHGCKVPKSVKLLAKGKDHTELISEVKDVVKEAKTSTKAPLNTGVKPKTNEPV